MVPSLETLLLRPAAARALFLLGHGSGADMQHPGMERLAQALAAVDIATLRFNFPYMTAGRRIPDRAPKLLAALDVAVGLAGEAADGLPLLLAGRSLSGRIASLYLADPAVDERRRGSIAALVCFAFPLYPAKKPSLERAAHLPQISQPMLFLSGDRDALADLPMLREALEPLGRRATLAVLPSADHSFHTLKRSGVTADETYAQVGADCRRFVDQLVVS